MHNTAFPLKDTLLFSKKKKKKVFTLSALYSFIHLTMLDIDNLMVRKNKQNPFSFVAYRLEGEQTLANQSGG